MRAFKIMAAVLAALGVAVGWKGTTDRTEDSFDATEPSVYAPITDADVDPSGSFGYAVTVSVEDEPNILCADIPPEPMP